MKKITVQIEDDVHKAFRLKAFKRGESLSVVLKKAIKSYIEGEVKPILPKDVKPASTLLHKQEDSFPKLVDSRERLPNKKYVFIEALGKYREVES